jgi:hypothetical protein
VNTVRNHQAQPPQEGGCGLPDKQQKQADVAVLAEVLWKSRLDSEGGR